MHYFNVKETTEYVFSRCVNCNGNEYVEMPREIALQIAENIGYHVPEAKDIDYSKCGPPMSSDSDSDYDFNDYPYPDSPAKPLSASKKDLKTFKNVNLTTGTTVDNGVQLKISAVPIEVLKKQDTFYGCGKCGKVFWEGSHWDRFLGQLSQDKKK